LDFSYCPRCARPLAERSITSTDGITAARLACVDECGFVHWNNPTPAIGAIVEHEGDIILARNAAWPAGFFALVAGYLEPREDPAAAVKREVKEELGLDVVATELVGNYIFAEKNEIMLCYHAVATGTIALGKELAEYKRVKPEKLRPWRRGTGFAVAEWMRRRGLAFEWIERAPLAQEPRRP